MSTSAAGDVVHRESAKEESTAILEEARMVLPGIQALFGFQLIAVFQDGFHTRLALAEKLTHFGAIVLVVVAIVLAIAPAAYQRQAEPHVVSHRFLHLASRMLTGAMGALALALTAEIFLVGRVITGSWLVAALTSSAVLVLLGGAWFAFPRAQRRG
jgi:hypothetical protein